MKIKTTLQLLLFLVSFVLILAGKVEAQQCLGSGGCTNFGTQYPSVGAPYAPPSSWQVLNNPATGNDALLNAGNFTRFSVVAGHTYEWSYCENYGGVSSSWDAQMTLYNDANLSTAICFSTDVCGTNGKAPYISWVATFTGIVRILTTAFTTTRCQTNSLSPYNKMVYRELTTVCTTPTIQSRNITFSGVGQTSMIVNWTNGNGSRRVVYINTVNSFTTPLNGTDPAVSTNYSGGQQCIYNGSSNSITIEGLTCATTYYVRVYEANCTGSSSIYYTSTATNNPNSLLTSTCSNGLIYGVDISDNNNQTVSLSQVYMSSPMHSFAYIKSSEGVNSPPSVTNYFNSAIKANNPFNLVLGAYHLGRPDFSSNNTAANEAQGFWTNAGSYTGNGFLPPALDMEDENIKTYINTQGHKFSDLAIWINDWCQEIYDRTTPHRWPVLYISRSDAACLVQYYKVIINQNIQLWIATASIGSRSTPGNPQGFIACDNNWNTWPWEFQQYYVPAHAGIDPNDEADYGMDQDVFNGTLTNFDHLINPPTSLPDLTITAGTPSVSPATPAAGSNITAYASEDNAGTASAGFNVVGLWLSASPTLNTNNAVYLGAITGYPSLSSNSNSPVLNTSVNIPSSTTAGTYYLFFWADGGSCGSGSDCSICSGAVNESKECNNFATVIINVTQVQGCTTPASPQINPTTNISSTSFTASWQGVSNATSYRLDVATDFGFTNVLNAYNDFDIGDVTSYNITGLTCNTDYYFRVRSYNDCGLSTTPEITPVTTTCCNGPSTPLASVSNITSTTFKATWTLILDATTYYLDLATNSSFTNFVGGYNNLPVGNVGSYNISGLTCNTLYYYRVKAANTCGIGESSATITVPTSACCTAASAPTANAATDITRTSFQANWTTVGGGSAYFVDVATDPNFSNLVYSNVLGNNGFLSANDLSCSTTYYYRVRASNACGTSDNSGTRSVTTSFCCTTPTAPTAITATDITTTSFQANWSADGGTNVYYVDVALDPDFYNLIYWNVPGNDGFLNINYLSCNSSYYYRIRASNACGTSDNSETISVTTSSCCSAPSVPTFSSSTGQFDVCSGSSFMLTANAENCSGCSYVWSTGVTGSTIPINNLLSATTYSVTVSNGCNQSVTASKAINVVPSPNDPITVNANPISTCSNSSTPITLTVNGTLSSGDSWQWYSNSCGVGPVRTGQSIQISPTNTATFYVRGENGFCYSQCKQITVNVNPTPAANAGPNRSICYGTSTTLGASPASSSDIYSWSPSTALRNQNTADPVANPTTTTMYTLTVKNSFGCVGTSSVTVNVAAMPDSIWIWQEECNKNSVLFHAFIMGGGESPGYLWQVKNYNSSVWVDSSNVDTDTFRLSNASNGMQVRCRLTSNAICPMPIFAYSDPNLITCVSKKDSLPRVDCLKEFTILPNPSTGLFTVIINLSCQEAVSFQVINSSGQIVYRTGKQPMYRQVTKQLPLQNLSAGIYILKTIFDNQACSRKIIVAH